jgi:hypothetical protein
MNEALAIAAQAKICGVKLGAVVVWTAQSERRPLSGVKRKSSALSEFFAF